MDKLLFALVGALCIGVGFYGVFSDETQALLGLSIGETRTITFENDPLEYSIQLVICFGMGLILIYSVLFGE